eukprot:1158910-Pelagomonas_calceolata.AAC.3
MSSLILNDARVLVNIVRVTHGHHGKMMYSSAGICLCVGLLAWSEQQPDTELSTKSVPKQVWLSITEAHQKAKCRPLILVAFLICPHSCITTEQGAVALIIGPLVGQSQQTDCCLCNLVVVYA